MIRVTSLEHRFVRSVPREIEPGILYVSMEYATALHSCCCGCGEQVVTPFTQTDWKMTYDGASVSLTPSIGNWQLPCRSHYFIRHGRVIEAEPWSAAQVKAEKRRDKAAKSRFYGQQAACNSDSDNSNHSPGTGRATSVQHGSGTWWSSVVAWLKGK